MKKVAKTENRGGKRSNSGRPKKNTASKMLKLNPSVLEALSLLRISCKLQNTNFVDKYNELFLKSLLLKN